MEKNKRHLKKNNLILHVFDQMIIVESIAYIDIIGIGRKSYRRRLYISENNAIFDVYRKKMIDVQVIQKYIFDYVQ